MHRNQREYTLSKDQPILRQRRGRRPRRPSTDRGEADFWMHFDLDKFARDWRRGLRERRAG